MDNHYLIPENDWKLILEEVVTKYHLLAPIKLWEFVEFMDYEIIKPETISKIIYNVPKPASPLKTFFLPIKENVTIDYNDKDMVIMGAPGCDLYGLSLIDEMYRDEKYPDPFFTKRREKTVLIGTPCFETNEHCHCTAYDVKPYPDKNYDISIARVDGSFLLSVATKKGNDFIDGIKKSIALKGAADVEIESVQQKSAAIAQQLVKTNSILPDYNKTSELVEKGDREIWKKYAATCVSCGACTTTCPTCTCFLLIDRKDFEKVRNIDACQFPGFERVAAGENPLRALDIRFRNRYMCKYVWKPAKFKGLACTGCGRCIESCIGKINKNELFVELNKQ